MPLLVDMALIVGPQDRVLCAWITRLG